MNKTSIVLFLALIIATSEGWLPPVSGYDEGDDNNGYAGVMGRPISAIRVSGGTHYRVHLLNSNKWLPAVTGNSVSDANNGYAGIEEQAIDLIAVEEATYKVHVIDEGWSDEKSGYNTADSSGYAGTVGKQIDAIMIKGGRTYAVYSGASTPTPDIDPDPDTPITGCSYVSTGTGVAGIDFQWNIPNMREGCLFMAYCVQGGLCQTAQISKAYTWASQQGYIRASDTLIYDSNLGKYISQHFGTTYHSNWVVRHNSGYGHWWLVDANTGKEIFNASGIGAYET